MINQLLKLAKNNKNIVVLSSSTVDDASEFAKYFPERFFDFGLGEQNMISVASGLALSGKLPIVFGNGNFLIERAFEQIKSDVCVPNLNVKIIGFGGGSFNKKLAKTLPSFKVFEDVDSLTEMVESFGPMYLHS